MNCGGTFPAQISFLFEESGLTLTEIVENFNIHPSAVLYYLDRGIGDIGDDQFDEALKIWWRLRKQPKRKTKSRASIFEIGAIKYERTGHRDRKVTPEDRKQRFRDLLNEASKKQPFTFTARDHSLELGLTSQTFSKYVRDAVDEGILSVVSRQPGKPNLYKLGSARFPKRTPAGLCA